MGADTVGAAFAEIDRLVPDGMLGIAVSGGGDSTALLIIAARWAGARGRKILAATVDHGLRADSADEADAVVALCAHLGIPHTILQTGDLRAMGGNLSAAARDARFALLGDWAQGQGCAAVLLGHTMDDQAETVLMRLVRGSGAEGLSAMQAGLQHSGMLWLRPLLGIRREALRAVLQAEGIGWIEDPTNEDPEYDRVKARQALALLAPLGIDAEGLARTAWHLQRQRRVLERAMDELAARARRWGVFGEVRLDPDEMAVDEPDTALRLLADTLVRVSGANYRPRFRALSEALDRILSTQDAGLGAGTTLSGCLIRPEAGAILICREPSACEPMRPLNQGAAVWDRRWKITVSGDWPASVGIGALGEYGLAQLRASAGKGTWTIPEAWASAPRVVRQTTPAIWLDDGTQAPDLFAAPLANYVNQRTVSPECAIVAENTAAEALPWASRPTYGRAGPP
ncbi:MAG TPA: tRNA lysidine(34) synthetase TilS [Thermohalobaculum sp.]|nr:tRNA lysidine(34) synthetase TilS [Thermohalobaculum sp.]